MLCDLFVVYVHNILRWNGHMNTYVHVYAFCIEAQNMPITVWAHNTPDAVIVVVVIIFIYYIIVIIDSGAHSGIFIYSEKHPNASNVSQKQIFHMHKLSGWCVVSIRECLVPLRFYAQTTLFEMFINRRQSTTVAYENKSQINEKKSRMQQFIE